jgi:two-component system response regulator RegA
MTQKKLKMLLVDDDPVFLQILSRAMKKRDFEIFSTTNEKDALKLSEQHKLDYAVIDLKLEHSSGLQLLNKLNVQSTNTKILVLTGYSSIATAVEAIK